MKRADMKDMELGNLIFGNSRGKYAMPRGEYQDVFCKFLAANGFDGYGFREGSGDETFENETFSIRPYYWGDDEAVAALPNFTYKPKGIQISWYKYPLRDSFCSHDITVEKLKEILDECAKSLAA